MRFFLFITLFLFLPIIVQANSTKIYNDEYHNPLNILSSFLWNEKKAGKIGLISNISMENRQLDATIHPISLKPSKIKIAFSKIKYLDEDTGESDYIFSEKNLEVLSKLSLIHI